MNTSLFTRRELLKTGALAAASVPLVARAGSGAPPPANGDPWRGLKVGVASYTLRKLPLDAAVKAIQRVGLKYVSIKDFHCPMNSTTAERKLVAQQFKEAGITPLSCGNVGMKNDEAQLRQAFEYARDLGLPTIVCAPPADAVPILDKMVKEFNIRIAIHNHGPEDKNFPSPHDVWRAIEKYDARIGFCIDVGHTARAKVDPAEAILKYKGRLYDCHFKDINSTEPNGKTLECGRGVLDLKAILAALLKINYQYLLAFEYEKDENDPLPGLSESIGYAKGLMAGLK